MSGKVCTKCRVAKSLTDFYVARHRKDGLTPLCKECGKAAAREWHASNLEKSRARSAAWKKANPEKVRAARQTWYAENLEKILAAGRESYAENRDEQRARLRKWASENVGKRTANQAKRTARQKQRTPKWLTREDFQAMSFMYEMARALSEATGIPHHVDHEIPLQGERVSGLHVPQNLQILTAFENVSKKNIWVPV